MLLRVKPFVAVTALIFWSAVAPHAAFGARSALKISPASVPDGIAGASYSVQLSANGAGQGLAWSVAAGALPPGLGLTGTGAITGIPTTATTSTFSVRAVSGNGGEGIQSYTIRVSLPSSVPAVSVTTTSVPGATVGTSYSATLTATGGVVPYSWSIVSGSLPAGITLNASGVLSGTPSSSGNFSFSVRVGDASGQSATQNLSLSVAAGGGTAALAITTTSLPSGTAGAPYSATLTATGGTAPYTWAAVGPLPFGLTLSTSGTLSGTPTSAGLFSFTIQAKDAQGQLVSRDFSISIASSGSGTSLDITTASLPNATAGVAYSTTLAVSGGTAPYTWSLTGGALPAGLALWTDTGIISGTTNAAGTYNLTVQVSDATGQKISKTLTLVCVAVVTINTTTLPSGTVGVAYNATLSASGGTAPYTWSVLSGQLPPGLTLSGAGAVSGTPTTGGNYSLSVQAADSVGNKTSQAYAIAITQGTQLSLDAYGGVTNLPCPSGPKSHFYSQKIGSRWHLCTPAGNAFFVTGVYNVNGPSDTAVDAQGVSLASVISSKYATGPTGNSTLNWGLQTANRLKAWGFNTLSATAHASLWPTSTDGRWGTADSAIPVKLPFIVLINPTLYSIQNVNNWAPTPVKDILFGIKTSVYTGYIGTRHMADYWDSSFSAWLKQEMTVDPIIVQSYKGNNNGYLLGYDLDETDNLMGFAAGPDFPTIEIAFTGAPEGGHTVPHLGWMTLVASPTQTANSGATIARPPFLYSDITVYTKEQFGSWLSARYGGNIAALNTAWGSNYTTFGSTATVVANEGIGTGNGSQRTFTFTLANGPVAPCSVQVKVAGVVLAGDGCANSTALLGPTISSGSIDFGTRAGTVTFATAPASGAPITVSYRYNGWGSGSGILDEDGRCPSKAAACWIPSDFYLLSGAQAAFKADLDDFLLYHARKYYSESTTIIRNSAPGVLILGSSPLGAYGTPPFRQILKAGGEFLDVITFGNIPPALCNTCTDTQQRIDFAAQHGGDKPWLNWTGFPAQADSYMSAYGGSVLTTQVQRGDSYSRMVQSFLDAKDTATGTYHIVGFHWWDLYDMANERTNWGLLTRRDNPYDGRSAVIAKGTDTWGYPTGGELANYGDFLTSVMNANLNAFKTIASGK